MTKAIERIKTLCLVLCFDFFIADKDIERNIVVLCWFGGLN